jgi:hypothetical protein
MNSFFLKEYTALGLTYIRFRFVDGIESQYYIISWQPVKFAPESFTMIVDEKGNYMIHPAYSMRLSMEIVGREQWFNEQIQRYG